MNLNKEEDEHVDPSSHEGDNLSNNDTEGASHSENSNMSADIKNTTKSDYQDSPLSKSMDFVFETKYVMLNFMSLVPPEMYSGHVSSSLESASPDPSIPHLRNISKSKSFDIGMHSRRPLLKHIGRFRSRLMDFDSPSSEDNITNRYHWQQHDSPDEARFVSDSATHQIQWDLPIENPNVQNVTSSQTSPRKSLYLARSQSSVVSSSGDFSYMSDADDEGDDFSNASSIFSSHSINNRDGFLDLRKSVHIMPPLLSQSEDADVVDGQILAKEDIAASDERTSKDESMNHVVDECDSVVEQGATRGTDVTLCSQRRVADRTKLKLNIPCQPLQLDDILLSLQTELSSEIDDLESEFEEALRSARQSCSVTPLTPQSEAARVLARIGDEVKVQYGSQLSAAVSRLTYEQVNNLTYEQFRDIALTIVDRELPGWRQVALLMVFGQKVVWNALQNGQKQFGGIIDLCSQLVADVAADFIIKQGGWGSVMNFDPSQSSDTLSSAEFDASNDLHDFFSSHNVTQVDSQNISPIEDFNKFTDHSNKKEDENVKQSVRLRLNVKETTNGYNGSHETDDSEKHDDEQIVSNVAEGEIFFADKMQSNNAGSINTLQYIQTGSFDRSVNKSRYASSIGFDIDEAGENTDVNPDMEENTSLAYFQVPTYDDRSQVTHDENKRIENTDSDFISASRDMSNGSPVFIFTGSQEGNCAQSDVASSKYDLNKGKGDTAGDYSKDSVYIKQATPITSTFVDCAIQFEQSNSSVSGNNVKDEPEKIENGNIDETIEVQQRHLGNGTSNVLMKQCDHFRVGESVDNSNNNNISNETHDVPPCLDITPSFVYGDNSEGDSHVDEEDPMIISDLSGNINSPKDITSTDKCEDQREMIQGEASSNQREVICDNSEDYRQENVNSSGQFLHHISRRSVQVGVITIAALAVAVCVKVISR